VRKVVKEIIPSWLWLINRNVVQLLNNLDVGNTDQDTKHGTKFGLARVLEVLFGATPFREPVNNFQFLDSDCLIPNSKLTIITTIHDL